MELKVDAANFVEAEIEIKMEFGDLELGKIDQEYITDPDLRRILADTELDSNLMKCFEGCKLRLITRVIYSERLGVKRRRKREVLSRWGQTTPQMGHEMSRFLVNF